MRETVGRKRRILLLLQAAREDAAAEAIEIETRLNLRDPGK